MAYHLVGARDELHESEASQVLMFCFDNASPEHSCFVFDFIHIVLPSSRVFVFSNATRIDRGYYMPARGYEFYLRVVNSISHE